MEARKPIEQIRAGAVRCSLWENEAKVQGRRTRFLKASLGRRYQDSQGVWQTSQSFSRNEIPLAIYCLFRAFEAIMSHDGADDEIEAAVEEERVR